MKRNEDNLRDLQDNVKHPNIRTIGVPEEEDKKKDHEKILEKIIFENVPKIRKEIITQVQETQGVPNRINPRLNTPIQFSSDTHSCPGLCDPMGCISPSLPVHHKLLELVQTNVY